jgi:hypothetical protein
LLSRFSDVLYELGMLLHYVSWDVEEWLNGGLGQRQMRCGKWVDGEEWLEYLDRKTRDAQKLEVALKF